jgi:hypothetical protein
VAAYAGSGHSLPVQWGLWCRSQFFESGRKLDICASHRPQYVPGVGTKPGSVTARFVSLSGKVLVTTLERLIEGCTINGVGKVSA